MTVRRLNSSTLRLVSSTLRHGAAQRRTDFPWLCKRQGGQFGPENKFGLPRNCLAGRFHPWRFATNACKIGNRTSVVYGKRVSVRINIGGGPINTTNTK